jgi:hypothetical protein
MLLQNYCPYCENEICNGSLMCWYITLYKNLIIVIFIIIYLFALRDVLLKLTPEQTHALIEN